MVKGCVQAEVGDVKDCKLGAFAREHTVDKDLEKFKRAGGGVDVAWVVDLVSTNGDLSAFWILLVGIYFSDNFGVGYFFSTVGRYVIVVDEEEDIGAKDAPTCAIGAGSNDLAQATKFFGVGLVPSVCVRGVLAELAVFK